MGYWTAAVDKSHAALREDFRAAGWEWHDTHRLGGGFPDGLVQSPKGVLYLIEAKTLVGKRNPKPSTSAKDYTKKKQANFAARFQVHVLCTPEEAKAWREERS